MNSQNLFSKAAANIDKKYELLESKLIIPSNGNTAANTVYRIRALKSFSDVKEGDLGGFVQTEDNLSHEGNCWIYDDARACQKARVEEDAQLKTGSWALHITRIGGQAIVEQNSRVWDKAQITGRAIISNSEIFGFTTSIKDAHIINRIVETSVSAPEPRL